MERNEKKLLNNILNLIRISLSKVAPSGDVLPYKWIISGNRVSLILLYNDKLDLDFIYG